MGEFEAIGDAITGAVVGSTVEPGAGEPAADGHTHERNCLNCGASLIADFCHQCGQRAHVHRTLSAFFHDLLHGVLHFEGKIWNTLPLLAWKPGELTRSYIEGQRARFVSPIALFLFSVFLMFAVASATGGSWNVGNANANPQVMAEVTRSEQAELAKLRQQREAAVREGRSTSALDISIDAKTRELAILEGVGNGSVAGNPAFDVSPSVPGWLKGPLGKIKANPELVFYKLKTNAYKYSWALIPLSVPFLWLLFPFSRRFRLYDHTVFVTYSLSFMTMLAVVAMLLQVTGLSSLASLLFFVPPIHMYRQLKDAYGLGRWSALGRTILLLIFSLLALSLFGVALFGMGLFD